VLSVGVYPQALHTLFLSNSRKHCYDLYHPHSFLLGAPSQIQDQTIVLYWGSPHILFRTTTTRTVNLHYQAIRWYAVTTMPPKRKRGDGGVDEEREKFRKRGDLKMYESGTKADFALTVDGQRILLHQQFLISSRRLLQAAADRQGRGEFGAKPID
jgi:hypothetical protein